MAAIATSESIFSVPLSLFQLPPELLYAKMYLLMHEPEVNLDMLSPKFAPPIEFVDQATLSPPEGYKDGSGLLDNALGGALGGHVFGAQHIQQLQVIQRLQQQRAAMLAARAAAGQQGQQTGTAGQPGQPGSQPTSTAQTQSQQQQQQQQQAQSAVCTECAECAECAAKQMHDEDVSVLVYCIRGWCPLYPFLPTPNSTHAPIVFSHAANEEGWIEWNRTEQV
uniref:Uncharacterized protein n=1 Tax=Anopheles albimanus TaxID=7167 RepID=A0A182FSC6_ANOAL